MARKDINRIKIVLVENKRTAKWLADQLGKDPATVSKWCTNYSQPSLETLVQVAEALDVDVRSLIVQTKKSRIEIEAEKQERYEAVKLQLWKDMTIIFSNLVTPNIVRQN